MYTEMILLLLFTRFALIYSNKSRMLLGITPSSEYIFITGFICNSFGNINSGAAEWF